MKKIHFLFIVFASIILISCNKESGPGEQAQIKFINASINSDSLEINADGVLLVRNVKFTNASTYFFISAGTPTIRIASSATGTIYGAGNLNFLNNINYTIVAADSINKMKVSVIQDTVTTPATGKAGIRFLHVASNTLSADFFVSSTKIDSSRSFNDQATSSRVNRFISIPANIPVNIKAVNAGTLNNITVLNNITFLEGKLYTILLRGNAAGTPTTPQALGFTILQYN